MGFLVPLAWHNLFSHYNGSIVVFGGCWIKNIFTQIGSCIKVLNLEKIWRAHYSYLMSCSRLGIRMNLYFNEDKLFVNYFYDTIESIIIFTT